ncbi:MAG TPA: M20/M25/M40 family metallo-hydrolase [Bacteroidales bacterium]|nr:M20/M25/M40 family metallo-hydrolase [Bacteroidales bacterium]
MHRFFILSLLLLQSLFLQGQFLQNISAEEKHAMADRLYNHVGALAHDSMLGREAGTEGEAKAMQYIALQFSNTGLKPLPEKDYCIPFQFSEGYSYTSGTVYINEKPFRLNQGFFYINPLVNYTFTGKIFFAGDGLSDEKYKELNPTFNKNVVIIIDVNYSDSCSNNQSQAYTGLLETAVGKATRFNPESVILVSSNNENFPVTAAFNTDRNRANIPVIGAGKDLSKTILKNKTANLRSECIFSKNEKTGYNVATWINNNKPTTIVIGAHYDHLGYGSAGSLSNDSAIHNGADDNASGVAVLIELAQQINKIESPQHNFLFIAFSAEEKGLLGSKAFINQNHLPDSSFVAMLNFDMVGRMDKENPKLNIIGTGTAAEWDSLIEQSYAGTINIRKSASGTAGSDQMSFYLKDIPVLFFITGMHEDYHKPSDDTEKINRDGMADVLLIALEITEKLNKREKLHFQKTESASGNRGKRPGVTLGVIPDHAWEGKGMRIDAVTKGKTADQAGMLSGDIVIQIGESTVTDIMSYMKALSAFKKGDKTKITYLRGQIENSVEVVF